MYTFCPHAFLNLFMLDVWITLHTLERYTQTTYKCIFLKDFAINGNPERNVYSYNLQNAVGKQVHVLLPIQFEFSYNK